MNAVAGILRNTIKKWNDEAILRLNPNLEALLPDLISSPSSKPASR
jgi:hypothetical protein